MATQLATMLDLISYLEVGQDELPTGYNRLLRRASDLIYPLIRNNYDSTNSDHVLAVKNAVCAQVEFYASVGELQAISGGVTNASMGKTSVSFDSSVSQKKLADRARSYLNEYGLLYRGINLGYTEQEEV